MLPRPVLHAAACSVRRCLDVHRMGFVLGIRCCARSTSKFRHDTQHATFFDLITKLGKFNTPTTTWEWTRGADTCGNVGIIFGDPFCGCAVAVLWLCCGCAVTVLWLCCGCAVTVLPLGVCGNFGII